MMATELKNKVYPRKDRSILDSLLPTNNIKLEDLALDKSKIDLTCSNAIGIAYLFVILMEAVILVVIGTVLYPYLGYASLPIMILLWGAIGNQCIILLHETAHRTFVKSSKVNQKIGFVLGCILGLNYSAFTRSHMQHHKLNGSRDDVEIQGLAEIHNIVGLLQNLMTPPNLNLVIKGNAYQDNQGKGFPTHLAFTLIIHVVLISFQYAFSGSLLLAILFTLSIPSTTIIYRKIRVFAEHYNHVITDAPITRSHKANLFDQFFFNGFGMNWHVEHHLYPNVPGYRLAGVHDHLFNQALVKPAFIANNVFASLSSSFSTKR